MYRAIMERERLVAKRNVLDFTTDNYMKKTRSLIFRSEQGGRSLRGQSPQGLVFLFMKVLYFKKREKRAKNSRATLPTFSTFTETTSTSPVTHNHYTNIFRFLQD